MSRKNLKLERKIHERVSNFCDNKKLIGCYSIIKKYADLKMKQESTHDWEDELTSNPYLLMKLDGIGFKKSDKVALQLGFPRDHEFRVLAYVCTALDETSKGSTVILLSEVLSHIKAQLGIGDSAKIIDTVLNKSDDTYKILNTKFKVTSNMTEARYLTKTTWYEIEKSFYNLCVKISKSDSYNIPEDIKEHIIVKFPFKLNEGQKHAVNSFDKFNINILTGWGGTGKTAVTKAILGCLKKCNISYTCLAPTGIASKVFTESTNTPSYTVHRYFYSGRVIDTDWLILDECSMYSVDHINMILKMIDSENPPKLLMIGDVGQLSPISAGDPFYSLIKLITKNKIKGNILRLEEIMRASSDTFIPHLCLQFTEGREYDSMCESEKDLAKVEFIPLENQLKEQLVDIINKNDFNFDNTLILIPQNTGDFGNNIVNSYLDGIFSSTDILYQDKYKTFRRNSYCMNTKNNKELNIYNGERIKLIDKVDDLFICEKIDNGEIIEYPEEVFKETVQLSYSLTVHKCQGITVENIVFVASNKFYYMNTKELVYTGLSRASKKLIILYDEGALSIASSKKTFDKRNTFLGKISEL